MHKSRNMFQDQDHEEAIQRLLRILQNFSDKLKIAMCLPVLIEKVPILLKTTEQCLFQEICNAYIFTSQRSKKATAEDDEDLQSDPKMTLLLEVLFINHEINTLTNESLSNISPEKKNVIEYVNLFIDIVEQRIRTTPTDERKYRIKLRNALASLEKSKTKLTPLKNDLEDERRKHFECVKKISEEIAKCESIIKETKEKHEESIKKIVSSSESKMVKTYLEMKEKQEALQNQIKVYKEGFEKVLQDYSNREEILRRACLKSEKEHMESLIKYDTEINALHNSQGKLEIELDNLKVQYKNLQGAFADQELTYKTIKKEEEEVLMRAFVEKIKDFSMTRAAKIIQKTWRDYLARMALKKKKKSKKN